MFLFILSILLLFCILILCFCFFCGLVAVVIDCIRNSESVFPYIIFCFLFIVLICSIIFAFYSIFTHLPICPNCDVLVFTDFCGDCGYDFSPTITCPSCDLDYDASKVPNYCTSCGCILP